MANIESETLLEKLTSINNSKENIKQTLIDIGGKDYIDDSTLFEKYPEAINKIHSNILNVCSVLELVLYGEGKYESALEGDVTYNDTYKYMLELNSCRAKLITNLNSVGISCTNQDTLEELVDKVLEINSSNTINK